MVELLGVLVEAVERAVRAVDDHVDVAGRRDDQQDRHVGGGADLLEGGVGDRTVDRDVELVFIDRHGQCSILPHKWFGEERQGFRLRSSQAQIDEWQVELLREPSSEPGFTQRAVTDQDLAEPAPRLLLARERRVELLLGNAALLDEHAAQPVDGSDGRAGRAASPSTGAVRSIAGSASGVSADGSAVFVALFLTGMSSLPLARLPEATLPT